MNEDGSDSQENPITDEASDPYDYSYQKIKWTAK